MSVGDNCPLTSRPSGVHGPQGGAAFFSVYEEAEAIYKEPAAHWASHMELALDMWVLSKFQELKTKTAMPATARAQLSCASATHPALISHHKPLFLISPSRALHGNAQGASEMKRLAPWRVAAHQTGPQECEPEGGGGGTGCRVIAVPNQAPSQLDETAAPSYQSTGT